jgi:hypothetical protein
MDHIVAVAVMKFLSNGGVKYIKSEWTTDERAIFAPGAELPVITEPMTARYAFELIFRVTDVGSRKWTGAHILSEEIMDCRINDDYTAANFSSTIITALMTELRSNVDENKMYSVTVIDALHKYFCAWDTNSPFFAEHFNDIWENINNGAPDFMKDYIARVLDLTKVIALHINSTTYIGLGNDRCNEELFAQIPQHEFLKARYRKLSMDIIRKIEQESVELEIIAENKRATNVNSNVNSHNDEIARKIGRLLNNYYRAIKINFYDSKREYITSSIADDIADEYPYSPRESIVVSRKECDIIAKQIINIYGENEITDYTLYGLIRHVFDPNAPLPSQDGT